MPSDAGTLSQLRRCTARLTHARRRGDVDAQAELLTEVSRVRLLRGEFDRAEAACLEVAQLQVPQVQSSAEALQAAVAHFRDQDGDAPGRRELRQFLKAWQAPPEAEAARAAVQLSAPVPLEPEPPAPAEAAPLAEELETMRAEVLGRVEELDRGMDQTVDRVAARLQESADHGAKLDSQLSQMQTQSAEMLAQLAAFREQVQDAARRADREDPAIRGLSERLDRMESGQADLQAQLDHGQQDVRNRLRESLAPVEQMVHDLRDRIDQYGRSVMDEVGQHVQGEWTKAQQSLLGQADTRDAEIAALIEQQLKLAEQMEKLAAALSARAPGRPRSDVRIWLVAIASAAVALASVLWNVLR